MPFFTFIPFFVSRRICVLAGRLILSLKLDYQFYPLIVGALSLSRFFSAIEYIYNAFI